MSRKGVWGLQGVRDKYLKSLWVQEKKLWALGGPSSLNHSKQFGNPDDADPASARSSSGNNAGAKDWDTMSVSNFDNQHLYYKEMGTDDWYVMGRNMYGSLGMNQGPGPFKESSPIAYPAGSGKTWGMFASSRDATIAVKTDGTLWAWGQNDKGQLGQNERTKRSSPVQIGTDTDWSYDFNKIMLSSYPQGQVGAIKTDGTMWTWGGGGYNGTPSQDHRSSPTQIGNPGETGWSKWHNGMGGAIKTDGTCWVWGTGWMGRLGLNQGNGNGGNPGGDYSSPKQLPGTNWKHVGTMGSNRWAVKTDGTLWVWGYNNYGNLGLNTQGSNAPYWGTQYSGSKSSPTQLMSDKSWATVDPIYHGAIAISTDGELWGWGANNGYYAGGQLGQGTTPSADNVNRSSPVLISGGPFGTKDGEHATAFYCWGMIKPAIPADLE